MFIRCQYTGMNHRHHPSSVKHQMMRRRLQRRSVYDILCQTVLALPLMSSQYAGTARPNATPRDTRKAFGRKANIYKNLNPEVKGRKVPRPSAVCYIATIDFHD